MCDVTEMVHGVCLAFSSVRLNSTEKPTKRYTKSGFSLIFMVSDEEAVEIFQHLNNARDNITDTEERK